MVHKQERILHETEEFCVRKAKPEEAEELRKLINKYVYHRKLGLFERLVGERLSHSNLSLVAIEKGTGKVIGGIEAKVDAKEHSAGGIGLAVLPEWRHRGVGTALAEAGERKLEEMGMRVVEALVASKYAYKIARKQGYLSNDTLTKFPLEEKKLWMPLTRIGIAKELGEEEPAASRREQFEKAAQDIGEIRKRGKEVKKS